ncbi:MAG: hypothetical protein ACMG6E_04930 [Candidatus Roizmanbacteria bacterium]
MSFIWDNAVWAEVIALQLGLVLENEIIGVLGDQKLEGLVMRLFVAEIS